MLKFFGLIIAIALYSFLAPASGKPITSDVIETGEGGALVVGGVEATQNEFPWQVSLQWVGGIYCAGVIISESAILTSASCADASFASSMKIHVGRHNLNLNQTEEINAEVRNARSLTIHPNYLGGNGPNPVANDIAIIKLPINDPLVFNDAIQAIQLPLDGQSVNTGFGTISGWGASKEEYLEISQVLMKAQVPVIDDVTCKSIYGEDFDEDSMICAGDLELGGLDFCTGDVGGPLMMRDENDSIYLAGISSWGQGCGAVGFPGVYTEVSHFLEFIQNNLN